MKQELNRSIHPRFRQKTIPSLVYALWSVLILLLPPPKLIQENLAQGWCTSAMHRHNAEQETKTPSLTTFNADRMHNIHLDHPSFFFLPAFLSFFPSYSDYFHRSWKPWKQRWFLSCWQQSQSFLPHPFFVSCSTQTQPWLAVVTCPVADCRFSKTIFLTLYWTEWSSGSWLRLEMPRDSQLEQISAVITSIIKSTYFVNTTKFSFFLTAVIFSIVQNYTSAVLYSLLRVKL